MQDILNHNIMKVWSKFVVSSVVGVVLNTIYSVIDGMFVGQGVGEVGLASINIVWPAITVIIGIGLLIGVGSSSIMAIQLGKGDKESAERILATSVKSIILIGILVMMFGLIFREPILKILGAKDEVLPMAREYFTVLYIITIPYIFSNALNPIVRADGNPNLSMIMIGIGAVLNIILDWLLVIKFNFGVAGAAAATGASIFISTIVPIYYFTKGKANIKLKKMYFRIDKNILIEILKVGFVSFAIQISYGLILFIQNNMMYAYGNTIDVAIYTVAAYINCFFVNTCMGVAQGVQPLIGYHYGANKINRMKKLLYITIGACFIIGTLGILALIIFGKDIVVIFGISNENIEFAYQRIVMYCLGNPIIGIIFTMGAYYQSIGKNIYANMVSIGRGFIFQCLFTIILPPFIGVKGVFLSLPIAEALTVIMLVLILIFDKNQ